MPCHAESAEDYQGLQTKPEQRPDTPYGPEINDADPESSIGDVGSLNRDPIATGYMLMEMSLRAETAESAGDWPKALRYYRALAKAVPDRAVGFAKVCKVYEAMSERELAIQACRRATGLQGAKLEDFLRYASLILDRTPDGVAPAQADIAEIDSVLEHLRAERAQGPGPDLIECHLGVKLESADRLRGCVERLEQSVPSDPNTFAFRFSLALVENDFEAARAVIQGARDAQLPAGALELMQRELSRRERAKLMHGLGRAASFIAVPVAALGAALALWRRRRRVVPAE